MRWPSLAPACGRLTTGGLLLAGLLLLLALLAAAATVVWRHHKSTEAALERLLAVDTRGSELALEALAELRSARRWDREFLLAAREFGFDEARSRYQVRIDLAVDNAISGIAQLDALTAERSVSETAAGAQRALTEYRDHFDGLAELYARAGYYDSGLAGEIRRAAHAVEAAVRNDARLTALHLEMRRREKDFQMRVRDADAARFTAAAAAFNRAAPAAVRALNDAYVGRFAEYVRVQRRIAEAEVPYLEAARAAEPLLVSLHEQAVARAAARHDAHESEHAVDETTVIAFGLLALAVALLGPVLIARHLGRTVRSTVVFAGKLAAGDLDARLPERGPSDQRALACALNAMAGALGDARARLQAELAFVQQLLDTLPFPVVIKARDGTYLNCNRAYTEFLGRPRAQIIGKSAADLHPPQTAAAHAAEDAELLAIGGIRSYETPLRRGDGAWRTVIRTKGCFDRDGQPHAGIIVALLDITDRVEQERRARALFDSSPLPITLESRRRLVQVNPAFEQVFGYAQQDVVGQPIRMLFRSDRALERLAADLREALPRGTVRREMELVTRDGRVLTCDVAVRALDPADLTHGVVAIINDITERARHERELQALFDSSPLAISLTVDRRLVRVNPAWEALYGYTADEVRGRTLEFLYAVPEDWERVFRQAAPALMRGETVRFEVELRARDGRTMSCELLGKALDPTDLACGLVAMVQDIGDRKRAELDRQQVVALLERNNRLLRDVDRVKSEFLATLSHELRTPLNHVLGFSELLREKLHGRIEQDDEDMLGDVHASGAEMLRLVDGLLQLAEANAEASTPRPVPIDPRPLLQRLVDAQQAQARRRSIAVELRIDPQLETALVDPEALARIAEHLLSNAIKFNRDGGRVCVRLRRLPEQSGQAPTFELEVEDTGIGIPLDRLSDLFKPFSLLDASSTRRHGGAGIGLALVKHLVDLLGGSIAVRSEAGNTCFTVRLPLRATGGLPSTATQ